MGHEAAEESRATAHVQRRAPRAQVVGEDAEVDGVDVRGRDGGVPASEVRHVLGGGRALAWCGGKRGRTIQSDKDGPRRAVPGSMG